MFQIVIGGRKIGYTTINDLQGAVKAELAEVEKRAKKVSEEFNELRRARRALIHSLGDQRSEDIKSEGA